MPEYVSKDQCEEYRKECSVHTAEQDEQITIVKTKVAFFEKMMWAIFGVLVSGFAGTIFAVLNMGR